MNTCSKCGRQNLDDFTWCPECGSSQRTGCAPPQDLLDKVSDRKSFIEFVTALADEREEAERMEREEPIRYQLGGAHNWQNGSISSFLRASLACLEAQQPSEDMNTPNWNTLAKFL